MDFFKQYSSNTYAGSGNQYFFVSEEDELHTGRVFYRISTAGDYNYSLLFSNIIDSTFADGAVSHKNLVCDSWNIHSAKVGKCGKDTLNGAFTDPEKADAINRNICDLQPLTFGGRCSKKVAPGEFFCSDPFSVNFESGEYLCLELTFSGKMIPYHHETLLPVFRKHGDRWVYSVDVPLPGMVGCDRNVKSKIGYLGDSITQGIGTELNSYSHWNSLLSEKLGDDFAYWNLGLGYGRANDLAADGAWLYKAKQNDIVVVCCGVNDICQGFSEAQIINDITTVVDFLLKAGKKVILQTVPPFDYVGSDIVKWKNINRYILSELSRKVSLVFDVVPYLQESEENSQIAKFGGHPDAAGCALWAEALYEKIKESGILP